MNRADLWASSAATAGWPTELRLAVECCRPAPRRAEIERLASVVGWTTFLTIVDRHRIAGLAARALAAVAPPAELGERVQADVAANLRAAVASADLARRLDAAGLFHLFVKGLTLSALAYGDPLVKMSADIDLLVDPLEVAKAGDLLSEAGFQLVEPRALSIADLCAWHRRHKETAWLRVADGVQVDLHSRLADAPDLLPLTVDSPRQLVTIASGIALPTLSHEVLPAYLAVHGASSCWFRLKWIADFAALIQDRDSAELLAIAAALGADRPMAQALLLSDRLFGPHLSPAIRERLWADRANRLSLTLAMRAIDSGEPTVRRFGTLPIHLNQLLMKSGPGFVAGEMIRQVRAALANRAQR